MNKNLLFLITYITIIFILGLLNVIYLNITYSDMLVKGFVDSLNYQLPLMALIIITLFNYKTSIITFILISWAFITDRVYSTLINDEVYKTGLNVGFTNEWVKVGNFPLESYIEIITKPNTTSIIISSILVTSILVFLSLIVHIIFKKNKIKINNKLVLIILIVTSILYYIGFQDKKYQIKSSNPYFKGINAVISEIKTKISPFERLDKFNISQINKPIFNNILFITDESIQYQFIKDNKLIKKLNDGNVLLNFNETIVQGNCSYYSNKKLLEGGYKSKTDISPPILFDYINNYDLIENVPLTKTSYNFLNKQNIKYKFESSLKYKVKERDLKVIQDIKRDLKEGNKFIYIEKIGIHFPYKSNLDESIKNTKEFINLINNKQNITHKQKDNILIYNRVLKKTFDNYIKYLNDTILKEHKNTLIIYTGDHGQNFNDFNLMTHCDYNNKYSYIVPSFIMTNNEKELLRIKEEYIKYKDINRLNHKNDLSGFILEMIGYDKIEIAKYYPSLLNKRVDEIGRKVYINLEEKNISDIDFSKELLLNPF